MKTFFTSLAVIAATAFGASTSSMSSYPAYTASSRAVNLPQVNENFDDGQAVVAGEEAFLRSRIRGLRNVVGTRGRASPGTLYAMYKGMDAEIQCYQVAAGAGDSTTNPITCWINIEEVDRDYNEIFVELKSGKINPRTCEE